MKEIRFAISLLCVLGSLPAHAQVTTGQAADLVLGQPDFFSFSNGSAANKLSDPADVKVDPLSGSVFVADSANHRVLRYSSIGAMTSGSPANAALGQTGFGLAAPGNGADQMNTPVALTIDANGTLWVADSGNHRILRFDSAATLFSGALADGELGQTGFGLSVAAAGVSGMNGPTGVVIDTDTDTLWVSDTGNNRILRFNNATVVIDGAGANNALGQENSAATGANLDQDGLDAPARLAFTAAGALWVADSGNNRVLRFDAANSKLLGADADGVLGQSDFTSGGTSLSAAGFNNPVDVDLDSGGKVYVSDRNHNRILAFPASTASVDGSSAAVVLGQSNFTSATVAGNQTGFDSPRGLFVTAAGQVWVADSDNNRVVRFSPPPPAPPAPPAPVVDVTPPTIQVTGKKSARIGGNRAVFRGTASDASGIARVEFKVPGKRGLKSARGTDRWKAVVRPKKGKRKSVIKIRAIDAVGNRSRFLKLKILRR